MKTFMEEYGLIVVTSIVIMIFIVVSTPVGKALGNGVLNIANEWKTELAEAMDEALGDDEEDEELNDGVLVSWEYGSTSLETIMVLGNNMTKISPSTPSQSEIIGASIIYCDGVNETTLAIIDESFITNDGGETGYTIKFGNHRFDVDLVSTWGYTPGVWAKIGDSEGEPTQLAAILKQISSTEGAYLKIVK